MALGVKALNISFVAHFLGIVGAVLVLIWCISFRGGLAWEATNKALIFNLHPVLMLIGFIIIGGQAIMSYKSLPLKKPEKKLVHLVLHAIALILGIIGIYTAFKFHNESNIANLYSLHSWLGIGVIVLYGIQNTGLEKYGPEAFLVNFTAIVTILYGTFVILTTFSQAHQEDEYSYSAI
ncbi:Transmembrane ascorbate ferrireductase 1 [Striga hermonthica]|uniref:ascorbate ferrireductase (transmembrane) n=1 Tax=Striga hermonthica TaxID=68872 RepID=A0A9N7RLM6_STRHE|nr:Transmembrane ascorbate ferrireductase 1 [Striga hermonthica]